MLKVDAVAEVVCVFVEYTVISPLQRHLMVVMLNKYCLDKMRVCFVEMGECQIAKHSLTYITFRFAGVWPGVGSQYCTALPRLL